MTFTQRTKNNLMGIDLDGDTGILAELSAIIHTAGSIVISGGELAVEILSESQGLTSRITRLVGVLYTPDITVKRESQLGKTLYKTMIEPSIATRIMQDCGIIKYDEQGNRVINKGIDQHIIIEDDDIRAYIRGVFLGGGYVSMPNESGQNRKSSGYRLEFVMNEQELAHDVQALLRRKGFRAKNILRNSKYVLYLYNSQVICDLLAYMGADKSVLDIYTEKVNRSIINDANRSANCISANIDKAVTAAYKQIEAINIIDKKVGLDNLPVKLGMAARARLDNPSATMLELAGVLNITKSGAWHRMTKLMDIYKDIIN